MNFDLLSVEMVLHEPKELSTRQLVPARWTQDRAARGQVAAVGSLGGCGDHDRLVAFASFLIWHCFVCQNHIVFGAQSKEWNLELVKVTVDRHVLQKLLLRAVTEHRKPYFLDHVLVPVAVDKGVLVIVELFFVEVLA